MALLDGDQAVKFYIASSWRNIHYLEVLWRCREAGNETYDFRAESFKWSDIDSKWQSWDGYGFRKALAHWVAVAAYERDMRALDACDACLLVQPCGRSAHLELGYAAGLGKRVAVWYPSGPIGEPELMLSVAPILCGWAELEAWWRQW
jgi:hypothetical protein